MDQTSLICFDVPDVNSTNRSNQEGDDLKNMSQSLALNKSLLANSNTQSRRESTMLESSQLSVTKNKQIGDSINIAPVAKQVPIFLLQELLKNGIQKTDLKFLMDHLSQMEKSQGGEGQVDTDKFWSHCKSQFASEQQDIVKKIINQCSVEGYISYVKLANLNNAYSELNESDNIKPQNNTSSYRVQTENPRSKVRSSSVMGDYRTQQIYKKLNIPEQISAFKIYIMEKMDGPKNAFNLLDKDLKGYFTQNDFLIVFKNSKSDLGHQELINVFKSLNSITSKQCGQIDFASFYSFFQMPIDTLVQYLPGGQLHQNKNNGSEQLQSQTVNLNNVRLRSATPQIEGTNNHTQDYLASQFSEYDDVYKYLTPHNKTKPIKFDTHSPNRNLIGEYKTMYPQDSNGDKQIISYEMKRVVKNNPLVRNQRHTDFNYRRNVDPVPSDNDPSHRYGIVKKQEDTMQHLVEGTYGRSWLENSIANQRERISRIVNSNRQSSERTNENNTNLIRTEFIKDSMNLNHLRSVSGQKDQVNNLWKIQKFRNTQGKITTNWSPEEQKRFPPRLKTEGQTAKNSMDNYQELLEGFVVNKANVIKQTDRSNKSVLS